MKRSIGRCSVCARATFYMEHAFTFNDVGFTCTTDGIQTQYCGKCFGKDLDDAACLASWRRWYKKCRNLCD